MVRRYILVPLFLVFIAVSKQQVIGNGDRQAGYRVLTSTTSTTSTTYALPVTVSPRPNRQANYAPARAAQYAVVGEKDDDEALIAGEEETTTVTVTSTTTRTSTYTRMNTVVATPTPTLKQVAGSEESDTTAETHFKKYKNVVYFTNWGIYGANFQPADLDTSLISHILYAFADIAPDGEVITMDPWADLEKPYGRTATTTSSSGGINVLGCIQEMYRLKRSNRNLKVLLSIGGWNNSPNFSPAIVTAAGRQRFADSAVKLVTDWGFDGIDIDWEYPSNLQEAADFVLLLKTCREALDAYSELHADGYHFEITIASPAGPQHRDVMDIRGMDPYVDAWHLMAYDYAGSWGAVAAHQANVFGNGENHMSTPFNTNDALNAYAALGISLDKIVVGMPLYGRAFATTSGLGQPYGGMGGGTFENGVYLYRDLPRPGATEFYDYLAMASYSYDPVAQELVTYDNHESVTFKATWIKERKLAGAVFWEASGDKTGSDSLIRTVKLALGELEFKNNLLNYPQSAYDNIKNGLLPDF